ncbi:FAD-binding monooxygenase [Streptomyces sp. NPDC050788]|uniref:FAD-dependent oxidoreductase n=1 Tax=Streptomyces sp. NPDC050788 TaxID=3155041 RepID=UPI00344A3419
MNATPTPRGHAVVIGASLGGLLAARALSESFERVTLIERDELPAAPDHRRGAPQDHHTHGLLARGRHALDQLFPGFTDELVAASAPLADLQADMHWYFDGRPLAPTRSGLVGVAASRPLIEYVVRSRVAAIPGVTFIDRCPGLDLTTSPDRSAVTGVRLLGGAEGAGERVIEADLVIDASGRGAHSPVRLEQWGYGRPREDRVHIGCTYMTQMYRREPHHLDGRIGTVCSSYPGQPRGGIILAQEHDRFIVTLAGVLGEEAPSDRAGMIAYAETYAAPEFAEIIRTAKPLGEPVQMRYPASVRRRYEDMAAFPEGFLVVADALCSFNPLYGQGITVAALEAVLLTDLLAESRDDLWRRFFRGATELVDTPWALVLGGDLRHPQVEGARTAQSQSFAEYMTRYWSAAHHDALLGTALLRVTNLLDEPASLLAPDLVDRVTAHC